MPPDLDSLPAALTTLQAAEVLNLSPDTLERAAKRGDAPVPFYRWGRSLRWPREPIRRLLEGLPRENSPPHGEGPQATRPGPFHNMATDQGDQR